MKDASWSLHFWCKFSPKGCQHSFFAPRSALATVFWKSQNPGWWSVWVGRAECAGALGGDLRGVRDLQIWDLQFRTCGFDLTRQLLPYGKGGGFKRYAHSAGPETQKKKMKKNWNWTSGRRNSSPERAIYPQRVRRNSKNNFALFSILGARIVFYVRCSRRYVY